MNNLKPAVFLDRDGTLIEDVNYISKVEDIRVIEGTSEAIKKLNDERITAILITNQSGVARGYFKEESINRINQALSDILKEKNVYLDGVYYCPHHPEGIVDGYNIDCSCRKPKPGLIYQALEDFKEVDLKKSYVVGDKASDIELAKNAGCKGILLKTGYGAKVMEGKYQNFIEPDYIAENILDAVNWILLDLKKY